MRNMPTVENSDRLYGTIKRSSSWLTGQALIRIELRLRPGSVALSPSAVTEAIVQEFSPAFIPDLGGADYAVLQNQRGAERTGREELFFAAGELIRDEPDGSPPEQKVREDVWYALTTEFERSDGKSISYRAIPRCSPDFTPFLRFLTPRIVSRLVPIRLNRVRFGFDLYGSRFLGTSILGAGPVVIGGLDLKITGKEVSIGFEERFTRREKGLPLERRGIVRGLQQALFAADLLKSPDELEAYCSLLLKAA